MRVASARSGLTVGRIAYLAWHAPRGFVERCAREGLLNLYLAGRGARAMERAVLRLAPLRPAPSDAPAVYFLSGCRFWHQTAFCAYSLLTRADARLRIVVLDDGTLTGVQASTLQEVFPGLEVAWAAEIEQKLDQHLPTERYPTLRRRRLVYPHLRKLTDVHVGSAGWKLVLDSDMLFHSRPEFLLEWLARPQRPCHMVDVEDAYGYSPTLMTELAGAPIPSRLNVGMCGLQSDAIDWDCLEAWCRVLLEREGSHYLQEQALVAMLTAGSPRAVAPAERYIVKPSRAETEHPSAALHHYVAETKAWYFRFGWQQTFRA